MWGGARNYLSRPVYTIFSPPGMPRRLFPSHSVFGGDDGMKRYRILGRVALPVLLLMSSAPPSWGWGRWGFRGPRVGVYLGGPGPWWYDPYYYDPYYANDPYYYPNSYYPYNPGYAPGPAPADQA